jgi:butyryl-CoA dehydrogenase
VRLTDAQRDVRRLAREFARANIAPYAAQWDRDASFPMQVFREMANAGLLGMTAPEYFGGSGADSVALALAVEEIARADASCALVLSMANSLSILLLMSYGTLIQQARFMREIVSGACLACFTMSEPHAGSNAAKMRTRAVKKGDRYVISGTKQTRKVFAFCARRTSSESAPPIPARSRSTTSRLQSTRCSARLARATESPCMA